MFNVDNLLDSVQRITIGISQTSGTGNFSVTDDSLPGWKTPDDTNHAIPDGTLIPYHRYYKDLSTAGFEAGVATYNAGSMESKKVEYSSAPNGIDAINWGTEDTIVVMGVTRSMMTNAIRVHTQLGWNEPLLFSWTGRSNTIFTPGTAANEVNFAAFLDHWSTDQIQGDYNPANLAWRPLDMNEKGSQTNTGALPYVGVQLRLYVHPTEGVQSVAFYQTTPPTSTAIGELWVDTDSDDGNGGRLTYSAESIGATAIAAGQWELTDDADWIPNANPYYLACGYLCMLLGRKGKVVNCSKILEITDEEGWVYNPTFANSVAGTLKTQLDAAIAADADLTAAGITHPHFLFMSSFTGGSDVLGLDSLEFALLMDDIIYKFYDPDAWHICKQNFTQMILTDKLVGPLVEDLNPEWDGTKLVAEWNADKCALIPTTGLRVYEHMYDTLHWNETGAFELVGRILNELATSKSFSGAGSGAIKVSRAKEAVGGIVLEHGANSDAVPAPNFSHFNTALTYFYLPKALSGSGDPFISHNASLQYSFVRGIRKNPPAEETDGLGVFSMGGTFLGSVLFDVDGPIEDRGDYFAIPATNIVNNTAGLFICGMNNWRGWYGYGQCLAQPTAPLAVPGMTQANEETTEVLNAAEQSYHGFVVADVNGKLKRLRNGQYFRPKPYLTTAGAASTQRPIRLGFPDFQTTDQVICVEARVHMQDDADATNIAWVTYRRTFRWTGAAWSGNDPTDVETIYAGDVAPDEPPSWDWIYIFENPSHRIALQIDNIEANWHCNFYDVAAWPIEQA